MVRFRVVKLVDANDPTNVVAEAKDLKQLAIIVGKSHGRLRTLSSKGRGMVRVGKIWTRLVVTYMADDSVIEE